MLPIVAAPSAAESDARSAGMAPRSDTAAPWRAAFVRVVGGLIAAAAIVTGGRAMETASLGSTDRDTLARVEDEVRQIVQARTAELHQIAGRIVVTAEQVHAAGAEPETARSLFDATAHAIDEQPAGRASATIFSPTFTPIAWSGRPAELPVNRLAQGRELFVAPGPLGPRLVYVTPVADRSGRRPAGSIAVERLLADGALSPSAPEEDVRLLTKLVPVSIRARYEGAGESAPPSGFTVSAADGRPLLEGRVDPAALVALRAGYRSGASDLALAALCLALVAAAVPFVAWRETVRRTSQYLLASFIALALFVAARLVVAAGIPEAWWWVATGSENRWWWFLLLRSPADLLATAALLLAVAWLLSDAVERRRVVQRHPSRPYARVTAAAGFALTHVAAGCALALMLIGHRRLLALVYAGTSVDPVQFSLHPFDVERVTFMFGVLLLHASVLWSAALLLRFVATLWRVGSQEWLLRALTALCWLAPVAVAAWVEEGRGVSWGTLLTPAVAAITLAGLARQLGPQLRRGSQAMRLSVRFLVLALPGLVFYPAMAELSAQTTDRVITEQLAPQALSHRQELQVELRRSLAQIDESAELPGLLDTDHRDPREAPSSDAAFTVWRQTELARRRLTSSVELYAADGSLVSRYALNLPADTSATPRWSEARCTWELFGEPLAGTEDRVMLHAGRGVCQTFDDGSSHIVGAIVVHAMLDYSTLPFLASQSVYGDLVQSDGEVHRDAHGRPIEFAMYGWGRTPIFPTAGTAWPISRDLLGRIYRTAREPLWEVVERGERHYRVFFLNDRAGIYALGYLLPRAVDHGIQLAELLTLAGVAYVVLLVFVDLTSRLGGYQPGTGRALLREIRGSYYRKLFLAFVGGAVVPVIALALLTRTYIATQLRDGIESAAVQTAAVAKRVVETVASQQRRDLGSAPALSDEVMVWVSRIINQDVNVFAGPRLVATSQRDLFASGDLPTRTPSEVYRALVLERQANYVGEERVGNLRYMVAAAPIRDGDVRTILTVPLALRQQEIEREIDALDRRVLLATVCFVLLGAAIGYYMAERIADPVNRLMRATGRIARGDLDARILTTSTDELRRLVDAFNSMAADLQRQRVELERTNRLAAWADMARQVAHDIKNPLTPIQLSAEHLRHVHQDRGAPLGEVLDSCVDTILSQVRLLRQISSEFSSFASSPQARLVPASINEVVDDVLQPYRAAPPVRVSIEDVLAPDLPDLVIDRTLCARALVNIIENALHAMPAGGQLRVTTSRASERVVLEVTDTGVGMDSEALSRLFEPYFSTRASGTGLGLTIAKRNVELNHGTIAVTSQLGRGTTVRLEFPVPGPH